MGNRRRPARWENRNAADKQAGRMRRSFVRLAKREAMVRMVNHGRYVILATWVELIDVGE